MTAPDASDPQLRALEADLVARLADDVAHEVRNPLNALVINLEVLRRRVTNGDTDGALGRIDVIAHEVRRVHDIVERFLALLRPERTPGTAASLEEAVARIFPLLALRASALRIRFEPGSAPAARTGLSLRRLAFVLLDTGMAALDLAGPDGHLSCIPRPAEAGPARLTWSGTSTRDADELERMEPPLRLARSILGASGGDTEARTLDGGRFEVRLTLPPVA